MAMLVVLPVPFIPTKTMTKGWFPFFFSWASSNRSILSFPDRIASSTSRRFFSTSSRLSSRRFTCTPFRRFSISPQIWSATETATSFSTRLILNSSSIGRSFSALSSVVATLLISPLKPSLSFRNIPLSLGVSQLLAQFLQFGLVLFHFLSNLGELLLKRTSCLF